MNNKDKQYGIPEEKKFPLDTRAHVVSAVKFFNYAAPKYRRALATRIIRKIHEYGIKLTPSDSNGFYKYYQPNSIVHHGIPGMKWGQKNGPPYPIAPKDHSAAEKKAGRIKTYSDKTLRSKDDKKKRKKQSFIQIQIKTSS